MLPDRTKDLIFEARSTVSEKEWNAFTAVLGANVFHTCAWVRYSRILSPGSNPIHFSMSKDGAPAAAALGFISAGRFGLGRVLTFDALPVILMNDEAVLEAFLERIESHCRARGLLFVTFHSFSYHSGEQSRQILKERSYSLRRRLEFVYEFKKFTLDQLFRNMDERRRRNIRAADKNGVVIVERTNEEGLEQVIALQRSSSQRSMSKGGPDIGFGSSAKEHPAYALLRAGAASIYVAEFENQAVSAYFFAHANGQVYHVFSGNSEKGFEVQAGTSLV